MRLIRVFATGFLLMALLGGCRAPQEQEAVIASSEFKTADELIEEAESREREENLSQAERTFGQSAGTYRCISDEINEQYWPSLELTVEGEAIFHANLLTGMGELRGSYTIDDDVVKVSVEQVSFTGFAGEKVTDIVFDFVSEDTLELAYTTPNTPVGITNPGDRFVRAAQLSAQG